MPEVDKLQLIDVVTDGRHYVVHVFYDQYFQGAIHEAANAWRAKLRHVDLGDFRNVDDARVAVTEWFAELAANSREEAPEEIQTPEFTDPYEAAT